jgi:hypothetical protein
VGGRLQHSKLSYHRKHPAILSPKSTLSELITRHHHIQNLHSNHQATLAAIRQKYWIISAKNLVKRIVHKCVTCFKAKPRDIHQLMGNLPSERVSPSPPFQKCGVDFCGPVNVRYNSGRGSKSTKAYISVFVCFTTKAIHLELVGSLSSESFIAARRIIAHRARSQPIFCHR